MKKRASFPPSRMQFILPLAPDSESGELIPSWDACPVDLIFFSDLSVCIFPGELSYSVPRRDGGEEFW